jgi:uncharacterized membrane protein YphA (DoxX/SURF4 family)
MTKNILSLLLLIVSASLNFKHGWDSLHYKSNPGSQTMMTELGITEPLVPFLAALTVITGILLLIPRTFFIANLLSAFSIVTIMALSLRTGNVRTALIEIPFLTIPLVMIWLKYPFKN